MKKVLTVMSVLLLAVGCGSGGSKEQVTVCTNTEPYAIYESGVQTFTSKGDKVVLMDVEAVLNVGDKATADEIEPQIDAMLASLNEIEGVEAKLTRSGDTTFTDTMHVDLNVAEFDTLISLGLVTAPEDKKITHVSLSETTKGMESLGFTCVAE